MKDNVFIEEISEVVNTQKSTQDFWIKHRRSKQERGRVKGGRWDEVALLS